MAAASLAACGASAADTAPKNGEAASEETSAETVTEGTSAQTAVGETSIGEVEKETSAGKTTEKEVTVTIAAAASLETCLRDQIIPLFEKQYPGIKIEGTYDSSGKLQTQIEEGAEIDVFFSAATKQMDALNEEGMIEDGSIVELLENKIVLIVPVGEEAAYKAFEDIVKADSIAIGDPDIVPAGQYAKESLTNLGLWEETLAKASLGTNVTEVLNWVAEGSAKAGIVYATDAAQRSDKVVMITHAPADSVKKAIYPIGMIKDCAHPDEAQQFMEFLQSSEVLAIFTENGFTPVK